MKKAMSKKQLSEKISTQKLVIGALAMVFAISAVLIGGRVVLAATDSGVERHLGEAVVLNALQNPDSEIALVLAKYILVSEQGVLSGLEEELGVLRDDENEVRAERVCTKYADSEFKFSCEGFGRFALPTATTTASELNRLGRAAIVDFAEVELTGTVSSTFNLYVGVATSTGVDYDASTTGLNALPDNLIDGYEFVTSSVDVSGANLRESYRNLVNSVNDAGTLGVNSVQLPADGAVVVFLQSDEASGGCAPGTCEAVSSTNRGYAGFLKYHFKYDIDL